MGAEGFPVTWTFLLDPRATHSSIRPTSDDDAPLFASPDTIRGFTEGFARSVATPADVAALLQLANRLLEVAVVHYEFAAVALEKSLQAVEAALRHRFDAGKSTTFKRLVERFEREMDPPVEIV